MKLAPSHLKLTALILLICNIADGFSLKMFFRRLTNRGLFTSVKCYFQVCCDEDWIISNVTGLKSSFKDKLHGQHLVQKTVLNHIQGHLRNDNPSKALVLSFHGPTGVGKNFVARLIAENLYKGGMHSKFVHLISATKEFPHEEYVPFYKDQLKRWIEGNVSNCGQSMFIFDEIDKMPSLLLDVVKPYLDYHQQLAGVNYRRAIFVFLSNTGSTVISKLMLDHWRQGRKREDLALRDVESDIMKAAINDDTGKGLWHSQVISKSLITAFIPFLPLEKDHIRLCVQDTLIANGYFLHQLVIPESLVDSILDELVFTPPVEQLYSSTGCKRVSEKVDLIMMDMQFQSAKDEL